MIPIHRFVSFFMTAYAVSAVLMPTIAVAECRASDEGNCCSSDADCVAYPYPLLCQVVALTTTKAAELKSVGDLKSALTVIKCDGARLENIREEARRAKVECDEGVCRLTDLGID